MPGRLTSKVYFARPVTFSGPSSRLTCVPSTVCGCGHEYLGSAGGGGGCAGPPRPPCSRVSFGSATSHPLHAGDRFEDARERPAPADVPVEAAANLFGRRRRILLEQRDAGHDEPRRAEPAHQRVLVAE